MNKPKEDRNARRRRLYAERRESKTCPVCGTSFKPNHSNQKYCSKKCFGIKQYNFRKDKIDDLCNNTLYMRYQLIKSRARKNSIPFDLELEDVISPEVCPILGIPIFERHGKIGPMQNSPSVDRIIPEKGYVKGNIRVISQKANAMKQDCSEKELIKFAEYIIKEYNLCLI